MIVESKVDTKALNERGQKVLNDITGVLEWYLDDGVDDDGDIRLASVKSDHQDDGESSASLAQALHDYGTLAKPLADQIDGLGNFDKGMIDEALELPDKLGEVSTIPAMHSEKARNAKLLRDQLTNLLQQRIRLVRSAARFVFRDHPEIYREVASAYSRKYRAAAKRSQQPGQAPSS